MIIAISGTPATGKTSVANELKKLINWPVFHLNEMAEKYGLYSGYDAERGCKIVDIEKVAKRIKEAEKKYKNIIIESHYAHEIECDIVIILRTKVSTLRARMREKGWKIGKIEENVIAEIMEVCKTEALSAGRGVYEIDTTGRHASYVAHEIAEFLRLYVNCTKKDIVIKEKHKAMLRKPFGRVIKDIKVIKGVVKNNNKKMLISVGDVTSSTLVDNAIFPNIIIIDNMVKRKAFNKKIEYGSYVINANNPRGRITPSLWKSVLRAINIGNDVKVKVNGEEDMAVIPCAIFAPNGSIILYGQPDNGMVMVNVDEKKKAEAREIVKMLMGVSEFKI
ncbi:MAG: hypothetical protein DRP03_02875 [Candidatus Aenigmatarchaeota archaeon]|nr:MAG: hypothetical protein DRP03_02875 [Candidatus Aenigmarchaeota archaeon]